MVSHNIGYVALDLNNSSNINEKRRYRSLKRYWNQLSQCQKNCIYTVIVILFITLYIISNGSENKIISVENDLTGSEEAFNSIRNPQDIIQDSRNQIGQEGQVLEQPQAVVSNIIKDISSNTNFVRNRKFNGPTTKRQEAVVNAFKHAWRGYKQFAWGHDHLRPISGGYNDWFGLGLSIVDSLDTMYIMGLTEEYEEAREWVDKHLYFDVNRDVNLFEVTIRVLGGLLGIYHLTNDSMYISKAVDLTDRLMPCFETESGIPYSDVNLFTRKAHAPKWSPDSSTSEVTTIQLEFRDLSRVTGNQKYEEHSRKPVASYFLS